MVMPVYIEKEDLKKSQFENEEQKKLVDFVTAMVTKSPEVLRVIYVIPKNEDKHFEFFVGFHESLDPKRKNEVLSFLETVLDTTEKDGPFSECICYSLGSYEWDNYGKTKGVMIWQN